MLISISFIEMQFNGDIIYKSTKCTEKMVAVSEKIKWRLRQRLVPFDNREKGRFQFMKKNWRTVLCGVFAMMMVVSFTACEGTEKDSSQSSEAETTAEESSAADTETDADNSDTDSTEADSSDTADADSSQADVVYGAYDIEAEDGIDPACADVIKAYFTAIEEQNFEDYKATLYDYYYNVYDGWLQDNYGYGMETTMEQMHQTLLDSAGGDNLVITGVAVKPSTSEGVEATTNSEGETEATEDLPTQYLHIYEELLGEGFADEVKKDVTNALVVSFTMKGTVDGGEEKTIMEGYDLMMVEKDGSYYILG